MSSPVAPPRGSDRNLTRVGQDPHKYRTGPGFSVRGTAASSSRSGGRGAVGASPSARRTRGYRPHSGRYPRVLLFRPITVPGAAVRARGRRPGPAGSSSLQPRIRRGPPPDTEPGASPPRMRRSTAPPRAGRLLHRHRNHELCISVYSLGCGSLRSEGVGVSPTGDGKGLHHRSGMPGHGPAAVCRSEFSGAASRAGQRDLQAFTPSRTGKRRSIPKARTAFRTKAGFRRGPVIPDSAMPLWRPPAPG
ncbi:hypothetical protein ACVWXU_001309 [Streptomyces sp. TE33382]